MFLTLDYLPFELRFYRAVRGKYVLESSNRHDSGDLVARKSRPSSGAPGEREHVRWPEIRTVENSNRVWNNAKEIDGTFKNH